MSLKVSDAQFAHAVDLLTQYVAIPSCSHPTSPYYSMETMKQAAEFADTQLKDLGFKSELVSIDGSAPYVIAEKIKDAALPTLLLYGHYDVQPVEEDKWTTPPFQLVAKDGRLYGRGASDDKGGIIAILTALRAYKETGRELPVNIRILFEGEEEYGSTHMEKLVEQCADRLDARALIVLDGANKDVETGTLSSSTRGLLNIHIKITALAQPVHSGVALLAPDPAKALVRLLNPLTADEETIPMLIEGREELQAGERLILREKSISSEQYAKDNKVVEGAKLRGNPEESIDERTVITPSLSIVNMTSGKPKGGNSIQAMARAQIGIRVLPGQDPEVVKGRVVEFLRSQPVDKDLKVDVKVKEKGAWAWKADLTGAFTKKYLEALEEHFPKAGPMPCGGALPILHDLQKVFPKMEMIVPGVEDPDCNAHSHNESQDIQVLRRSMDSFISFLDKAGQIA